jgi:hypothetical protein
MDVGKSLTHGAAYHLFERDSPNPRTESRMLPTV